MDAITIRGLRKDYGGRAAVDGLDLDIHTGEVFALLGPNGAGKTTTVEIAEGFRSRDAGEVQVLGTDPHRAGRSWRNRIGIVTQTSAGLDTRIVGLSGGQRRRLDVGLGIVGGPELVFLDEPTTGFDPQARRDFWDLIRSLAQQGTTILLTTHYLDEAEALADRVGVIAAGRLLALDTPDNLGGRGTQEATVAWEEDGIRHQVRTATPTAEVAALAARMPGGEVPGLTVTRPSLEDTYLGLIAPHLEGSTAPCSS